MKLTSLFEILIKVLFKGQKFQTIFPVTHMSLSPAWTSDTKTREKCSFLQAITDTWIPKKNRLTQSFKSKSSFTLLIGSQVICIKIRTNGLDTTPGLFHVIISDLAFAAIVTVLMSNCPICK